MFLPEGVQQHASGFVVTNDANGKYGYAEISQVIDGIAGAAGHHAALAMTQDQYRRFTRDARDFTVDEFIGNQVSQHRDAELGKLLNDPNQLVCRRSEEHTSELQSHSFISY